MSWEKTGGTPKLKQNLQWKRERNQDTFPDNNHIPALQEGVLSSDLCHLDVHRALIFLESKFSPWKIREGQAYSREDIFLSPINQVCGGGGGGKNLGWKLKKTPFFLFSSSFF